MLPEGRFLLLLKRTRPVWSQDSDFHFGIEMLYWHKKEILIFQKYPIVKYILNTLVDFVTMAFH